MKFDVVIGNPPYQEMIGGGSVVETSMPLYDKFISIAIELGASYITMVIPSRWMSDGKNVLNKFRTNMISCNHIESIYNFANSKAIFKSVNIAGGIMYFLYNKNKNNSDVKFYNCTIDEGENIKINSEANRRINKYTYTDNFRSEQYTVIRDNNSISIIDKVIKINSFKIKDIMYTYNCFGLSSNFKDSDKYSDKTNIKVRCSYGRITYTSEDRINKNLELIDKYKVIVSKLCADNGKCIRLNVLSKPKILDRGEVCSISYSVLKCFDSKTEAENMITYIKSRLFRFLVHVTIGGINISGKNYMFVPLQNFNKPWTDMELYKQYGLTDDEIEYINKTIKLWV